MLLKHVLTLPFRHSTGQSLKKILGMERKHYPNAHPHIRLIYVRIVMFPSMNASLKAFHKNLSLFSNNLVRMCLSLTACWVYHETEDPASGLGEVWTLETVVMRFTEMHFCYRKMAFQDSCLLTSAVCTFHRWHLDPTASSMLLNLNMKQKILSNRLPTGLIESCRILNLFNFLLELLFGGFMKCMIHLLRSQLHIQFQT